MTRLLAAATLLIPLLALPLAAEIRIGIIGADTSHATAFTAMFNDPKNPDFIPGFRVVAAYKGGSADIEESRSRVDKFAADLQSKYGVELVPDIAALLLKVDVVLLESVDGRTHLPQAKLVIAAGKPMFIDKPLASTLEDAREIARLAAAAQVKWWSASALRYADWLIAMKPAVVTGAITWGPGPLEEHHALDLSWYAIHPIEMLYTLMGAGCEEVTRTVSANAEVITGKWRDGRIGTVRTLKPYGGYGAVVFPEKGAVSSPAKTAVSYVPLVREIAKFFQTGVVPVPNEETLEMFGFMDAAQRSKDSGGIPQRIR
ncbi:MAG: Gfo/Idh/MocA family oxidoreductase [Bryobacteraceae bacterium]